MENLEDFAKPDLDKFERLADNFKWFNSQHDSIKKEYNGQYFAFQEQQILDSDINLERLIRRLNIKNYDRGYCNRIIYN